MATVKPAKAAAVTRILVNAGLVKSTSHPTMVKGYRTYTRGITSTDLVKYGRTKVTAGRYRDGSQRYTWVSNNTPTGYVRVDYVFSSTDRGLTREECAAKTAEVMFKAGKVLRDKGFRAITETNPVTGEAFLTVWREDLTGEVVVF